MPYYTKRNGRKRRVYEKNGKYFVYDRVQKFVKRSDITEENARRRSPPKQIGILETQIRELEKQLDHNTSLCANQYQQDLMRRGVDANTILEQARLIDEQRDAAYEVDQLRGQLVIQTRYHQQLIAEKEQELRDYTERDDDHARRIAGELDQVRGSIADREQHYQTLIAEKEADLERVRAEFQNHIATIDPAIIRDHEERLAAQTTDCRKRLDALRAEFKAQSITSGAKYDREKEDQIGALDDLIAELRAEKEELKNTLLAELGEEKMRTQGLARDWRNCNADLARVRHEQDAACQDRINALGNDPDGVLTELREQLATRDAQIADMIARADENRRMVDERAEDIARGFEELVARMSAEKDKTQSVLDDAMVFVKSLEAEVAEVEESHEKTREVRNRTYADLVAAQASNNDLVALNQSLQETIDRMNEIHGGARGDKKEVIRRLDKALDAIRQGQVSAASIGPPVQQAIETIREVDARCTQELEKCAEDMEKNREALRTCSEALQDYTAKYGVCTATLDRLQTQNSQLVKDNQAILENFNTLNIEYDDLKKKFRDHMAIQGVTQDEPQYAPPKRVFSTPIDEINAEFKETVTALKTRTKELEVSNTRLQSENEQVKSEIQEIEPVLAECAEVKRELNMRRDKHTELVEELQAKENALRILSYKLQCISSKERGQELIDSCPDDELVEE